MGMGLFQILHALFWAFAILLASYLWGGDPSADMLVPLMALAYVLVNGVLLAVFYGRRRAC